MKKVLLAAACCLAAAVAAAQSPQGYQPGAQAAEREKPAVKVREQPGAPMAVRVETKWVDERQEGLELYLVVTNAGQRPVRAYTVRVLGTDGGEGGCVFNSIEKRGKILQPGRARGQSTWRGIPLSEAHPEINVELDFVEFDDGGRWGVDTCQSADFLEGSRAGGRAAKREFKKKLDADGLDALLRHINAEDLSLAPPEGRSDAWKNGFSAGVHSLRERVRRADEDGGEPDVQDALRRPFDASEDQP